MDKIIEAAKICSLGFRLGSHLVSIPSYAGDAVLIAKSKDATPIEQVISFHYYLGTKISGSKC